MAKKTAKKKTTQTNKDAMLLFSTTGVGFRSVCDVMVAEIQKLPPNRRSAVSKLVLNFDDTLQKNGKAYQKAVTKNDATSQKKIIQDEYVAECMFLNGMMRLGCSHIIEKMQQEAQKHTRPNKDGKKFDMFQVIRHSSIYYPDDIAVMQKKGYDFNAKHTIGGKAVDFTEYNLGIVTTASARVDGFTKGMVESIRAIQAKRNALIGEFQRLEEEKKKASASRKKAIDKRIETINKQYQELNKDVDANRFKGEALIEEFIAARQRLLKAKDLGCLSQDNVAKIEDVNMKQLETSFKISYARFQRVKNAIYKDTAASNENKEQSKKNTLANNANKSNAFEEKGQDGRVPLPLGKMVQDDEPQEDVPLSKAKQGGKA